MFKKISHREPNTLKSLVNCSQTDRLTVDRQTGLDLEWTPLPVGSAKNPVKPSSKASLVRHVSLYNALPLDLKLLNPSRLKRKLLKLNVTLIK